MKSKEQIVNDSIKLETPPEDYNLIEIHCFLALKQLTVMFYNKQISKENAGKGIVVTVVESTSVNFSTGFS